MEPAPSLYQKAPNQETVAFAAASEWLNSKLTDEIFLLLNQKNSSTYDNHSVVLDQGLTIYTQRLPYCMIVPFGGASPSSIHAKTGVLDTGSQYNIFRCSALYLGWQSHMRPGNNIHSVGDDHGTLLWSF